MFSIRNIAIFLGLFAVNNIVYLTPSFGNPYYGVMALGVFALLYFGRFKFSIYGTGLCLLFAIVVSLLFNEVPSVSKPWFRFIAFIIVFSLTGPLLRNEVLSKAKYWMFWSIRAGTAVIGALSLPARVFGLGRVHGDGYYAGLTVHSVTLGLVASNAFLFFLYAFLTVKTDDKRQKNILLLALFSSFCCTLATGSRAAVLGTMGGSLVLLKFLFQFHGTKLKRYLFLFAVVLVCSFPIWKKHLEILKNKNGGSLSSVNVDSRSSYWKDMWMVYCNNPMFGVGYSSIYYGTVDVHIEEEETGKGQVEPGNSWLAVLSMTGSLGGLAVLCILLQACLMLKKQFAVQKERTAFLVALLCCEVLHMCAEGYIFAAGGFGFFNFWCLIGTIFAYNDMDDEFVPVVTWNGRLRLKNK